MDVRKRCKRVLATRCFAHDIAHVSAAYEQRIADKRAMAAPRYRFRAHDRGAVAARQLQQPFQPVSEFWRTHIVGIPAKRRIAPTHIWRIFLCVTPAPETWQMHVGNPSRT